MKSDRPAPRCATEPCFHAILVAALIVMGVAGCSSHSDRQPSLQPPPPPSSSKVTVMNARPQRPAPLAARAMFDASEPVFDTEQYDAIHEEGFLAVDRHPLSTFSIDVDTASYSNVRRFLRDGTLPPHGAVRIEEMLNYFRYDTSVFPDSAPLAVTSELMPAPWSPEHGLVRIGVRAAPIDEADTPPRNLTFLIDVSGSMQAGNKLPLLRRALAELVMRLRPRDHVAIVVYAGASGLVLPPTSGAERGSILESLAQLEAGGSTNGGAGIELAYRVARENQHPDAINRVILATDGDFNVGTTNRSELVRLIEREREGGIFLTVLGVGTGNLKDASMEELADRGNGNYAYLDSLAEARKVLVEQAGSTLVTVAKDVKIQVEFNPAHVSAFRLIGYENRRLRDEDFNDDRVDAGEVGAGHSVTALYEIVPVGGDADSGDVDPLRYQQPDRDGFVRHPGELMQVKLRYQEPDADESRLLTHTVAADWRELDEASDDLRFSAGVALFGMLLRESEHAGEGDFRLVAALATDAVGEDPGGHRAGFAELVARAERLSDAAGGRARLSRVER